MPNRRVMLALTGRPATVIAVGAARGLSGGSLDLVEFDNGTRALVPQASLTERNIA